MKTPLKPLTFLSSEERDILHANNPRMLWQTGMRIDHDEALELLAAAGCRVDHERRIATFPPSVVQGSVDRLREAFRTRQQPVTMAQAPRGCPE